MYLPNQIVEFSGKYGRVMYYDHRAHIVHVLFKLDSCTWKVEKCDEAFCKVAQVFLWGIETPFCIRHRMRVYTPRLVPTRTNTDHIMQI